LWIFSVGALAGFSKAASILLAMLLGWIGILLNLTVGSEHNELIYQLEKKIVELTGENIFDMVNSNRKGFIFNTNWILDRKPRNNKIRGNGTCIQGGRH
jgi:hypothetical protein